MKDLFVHSTAGRNEVEWIDMADFPLSPSAVRPPSRDRGGRKETGATQTHAAVVHAQPQSAVVHAQPQAAHHRFGPLSRVSRSRPTEAASKDRRSDGWTYMEGIRAREREEEVILTFCQGFSAAPSIL